MRSIYPNTLAILMIPKHRFTVVARSEITVTQVHEGGGLYRHHYAYVITLDNGTKVEITGSAGSAGAARNRALRESGKLIDHGYDERDWEEVHE
jgi:hypothetical protein